MFGIFEAITDFFSTIFAIIDLVITVIVAIFQYLWTALMLLEGVIEFVPIQISAPLLSVVILGLIFKIAGRNSSSDT